MLRFAKRAFAPLLACLMLALPAQAFDTRASAAFVVDIKTGTILLSKNADQPLPPASMSKLMTLYMAFEAVRVGLAPQPALSQADVRLAQYYY